MTTKEKATVDPAVRKRLRILLTLSLVLYVSSMFFTAFTVSDYDGVQPEPGFLLFIGGAFSILGGGLLEWIFWLANPFFIFAAVFRQSNRWLSIRLSTFALVLSLLFLLRGGILVSENGRTAPVAHYGAGYFLWLSAFIVIMYSFRLDKTQNNDNTVSGSTAK